MCFLARLVLPSERIVSAEKLGGARGPGLRGQGCGARRRVGSGVRSGLGTGARQAVSRVRRLLAELAACWYVCSGKPPGSLETETREPSVRPAGFVL